MRAYKTYKNGTGFKYNPRYQSAIIAFDVEHKQTVSYQVYTIKCAFHFSVIAPICLSG